MDLLDPSCVKCDVFIENIKEGLKNCFSYNEKIRLLSIIPKDYSQDFLIKVLPNITVYMTKKSRSIEMYKQPDAYAAHPLPVETIF